MSLILLNPCMFLTHTQVRIAEAVKYLYLHMLEIQSEQRLQYGQDVQQEQEATVDDGQKRQQQQEPAGTDISLRDNEQQQQKEQESATAVNQGQKQQQHEVQGGTTGVAQRQAAAEGACVGSSSVAPHKTQHPDAANTSGPSNHHQQQQIAMQGNSSTDQQAWEQLINGLVAKWWDIARPGAYVVGFVKE